MRWRNVQVFGWKEFRPSWLVILLCLVIIAVIISASAWFSLENRQIVIPPEVQAIVGESSENETVFVEEVTVQDDDKEFYEVNTFFFSSVCVFQYRQLMDDLQDLKEHRFAMEQAGDSDKLAKAEMALVQTRADLRRVILDCSQ